MWFWWIWSLVWDLPACSDISANLGERNLDKIRHIIVESSFPRTLQSCSKCDALWKDQSVVSIQCLKCGNRKICVASAQVRCSSFPSAEEKKRLFQCYQRVVVMLAGFFSRQKSSNIMAWDSFLVIVTLTDVKRLCSPVHRLTDLTEIFLKGFGVGFEKSCRAYF